MPWGAKKINGREKEDLHPIILGAQTGTGITVNPTWWNCGNEAQWISFRQENEYVVSLLYEKVPGGK